MSKYVQAYSPFFFDFKSYIPELILFNGNNIDKDTKLVIFSGGEDISPFFYKGGKYYLSHRDQVEHRALEICLDLGIKILGVCRGHQLINAFLGAKFIQDIHRELGNGHPHHHPLDTEPKSIIDTFFFEGVNSLHHQGVYNAGTDLTVTSMYNGVVESTESKTIITTQFHPEFMLDSEHFFKWVVNWANKKELTE